MSEFCAEDDCYEVAVGFGRWEGRGALRNDHPKRPRRCRPHHLAAIAGQIVRCQVIAPEDLAIVDVRTGRDVAAPDVVELDPAETNIAALVAGGLVKVLASDAKAAAKPKG
jgi:hypothetical protein